MDYLTKLKYTIDALFGTNVSRCLIGDITFSFYPKNRRLRDVYCDGIRLCTLRIDGGLAVTVHMANMLIHNKKFLEHCLEIDSASKHFVERGMSVFCNHVIWCGKKIRIQSEVPVLYQNKVIAVGKAVLSYEMITSQESGVAVKIRNILKCNN